MKEECLICKAPLEYLETDVLMECEICHKKENSKTRCVNGHYYTFLKDPQLRSFVLIRLFCILILKNLLDKY
jgi:hypothetical protein